MIICGVSEKAFRYVASKTPYGCEDSEGFVFYSIYEERCGDIKTACILHDYFPSVASVEASIATDIPITRRFLRIVARYVFNGLNCNRITAKVAKSNERSQEFLRRLGFKKEGVIRLGYGKEDMLVFGILRNEVDRWLK